MATKFRPSFHQLVALEELAKLREQAGYAQRTADQALGWGRGMVARYEMGQKDLLADDLTAMLRVYQPRVAKLKGTEPDAQKEANQRLRQANQEISGHLHLLRGRYLEDQFWDGYDWVTPEYDRYLIHEQSAWEITVSQSVSMPGLLQSYRYSLEMSDAISPVRIPDLWLEYAEVRKHRQEILLRTGENKVEYRAFLAEGLLRQSRPGALADQLMHLLEVAEFPNVSIRVVPNGTGIPVYGYDYLKLPYGREMATTSLPDTTLPLDEERQLRNAKHYLACYEEAALSDADTIALINKVLGDLNDQH